MAVQLTEEAAPGKALGMGLPRLKMLAYLMRNPALDEIDFTGKVVFDLNNAHQNVAGQLLPAPSRISLDCDPVL